MKRERKAKKPEKYFCGFEGLVLGRVLKGTELVELRDLPSAAFGESNGSGGFRITFEKRGSTATQKTAVERPENQYFPFPSYIFITLFSSVTPCLRVRWIAAITTGFRTKKKKALLHCCC